MAKRELARFFSEYLAQRPDVRAQLESITNSAAIARALVAEGQRAGFEFSERDVQDAMDVPEGSHQGELADAELEAVAGGRSGGEKLKYMEFKLKEVLITG